MAWARIVAGGGVTLAMIAGAATMVPAQTSPITNQHQRLQAANRDAKAARERSDRLSQAARNERDQAAKAQAETAAMGERIRAAQADIVAARARIAIIRNLLEEQRATLAERQGPIARLIAALQSMARRPALASVVQPGSTRDMVHVRAMLATIMPAVEARTAAVRGEIAHVQKLRKQAAVAVKSLSDGRRQLEQERLAFTKLEAAHRARSAEFDRRAMFESDRAIAMGERARDLVDQMQVTRDDAQTREALAALPGPLPRPETGEEDAKPRDDQERGGASPYILAVTGQLKTGLGEVSPSGVRSRGLTIATWPGAKVVAPAAGTIRYAGAFRSFGTIVIIDHGKGWTTLITGLGSAGVKRGEAVRQGESVGNAPQGDAPQITIELRRRNEPIDMTGLMG